MTLSTSSAPALSAPVVPAGVSPPVMLVVPSDPPPPAPPPAPSTTLPPVTAVPNAQLPGIDPAQYANLQASYNQLAASSRAMEVELSTLRNRVPAAEAAVAENATLVHQINTLRGAVETLRLQVQSAEAERQTAHLQAYLNQRLLQEREAGVGMILEVVGGASVDEIEASITRAKELYSRYSQPAAVTPAGAPGVVRATSITAVAPVPQVQVPSPMPLAQVSGQTALLNNIAASTGPDAVRSGAYAQNREAIMAGLRAQGPQGTSLGVLPRYVQPTVAGQFAPPQLGAPVPPTPAMAPQPMYAMQPAQQVYGQPPGQLHYAQPVAQQPSYAQPPGPVNLPQHTGQVMTTFSQPQGMSPEVQSMRAQAQQAAQHALANPTTMGGANSGHSQALAQHGYAPTPVNATPGAGPHPMIRNT